MRIGLVTDSTCDLGPDILEKYNIELASLSIHFGDEVYLDRIELQSREFFDKLEKSLQLPTTSQPAIGLFVKLYRKMSENYDVIISIHISKRLSGTADSARMAAAQLPELDIRVIDSQSVSLGLGLLTLLTARMIEAGSSPQEIVEAVTRARDNIYIYFSVNDLSYLEKGGRIGKAQALLGSILNFYPLLYLPGTRGEILPQEKVRGQRKVIKRMLELSASRLEEENYAWLGLLHGTGLDSFNTLKSGLDERLASMNLNYSLYTSWISSVLGCHVGPSAYGIVILKGDFLNL